MACRGHHYDAMFIFVWTLHVMVLHSQFVLHTKIKMLWLFLSFNIDVHAESFFWANVLQCCCLLYALIKSVLISKRFTFSHVLFVATRVKFNFLTVHLFLKLWFSVETQRVGLDWFITCQQVACFCSHFRSSTSEYIPMPFAFWLKNNIFFVDHSLLINGALNEGWPSHSKL